MAQSPLEWLLASDPSIRWQAMRDLLDALESEYAAERRKVETSGWGAALLSHQDPETGTWGGPGAFGPADVPWSTWRTVGQPFTATCWALTQLAELGLDPGCARARRTVELVGRNSHWEEGGQPFWDGEVEECINGRTVQAGAYFGVDVAPLVRARLLHHTAQQPDGGWNCERANGSVVSSFATTINVLEGLLEFEKALNTAAPASVEEPGGNRAEAGEGLAAEVVAARRKGEEYLLQRRLFRRLSTGETADEKFLQLLHPTRWHYDVLWALDYFRSAALFAGARPDPRLREAVEVVRAKRRDDGRWALERDLPGKRWIDVNEGVGKPSPWLTLKAMRVLKWWDGHHDNV